MAPLQAHEWTTFVVSLLHRVSSNESNGILHIVLRVRR